jgi:F-type H+-transporting ATPase subunit b
MSPLRVMLCALIVCTISVGTAVSLRGEEPGGAVEHLEKELSHAAHSDPDHSEPDPLSVDPDLALWTVVVFVVLLLVLRKFAWGPILHALEGREQNIANHIAQAERNHEEAKRLLAQYEQKLAGATGEIRALMEEARREAEHAKQQILAEAKAGAEAERARSLHEIEAATDAALKTLAERSAQMAVELAGKILQSRLSTADHARLIEEAMAKFPKTTASSN